MTDSLESSRHLPNHKAGCCDVHGREMVIDIILLIPEPIDEGVYDAENKVDQGKDAVAIPLEHCYSRKA